MNSNPLNLTIQSICSGDEDAVRELILNGLAEHFHELDPGLNPDLVDICATYADAKFLVASLNGRIVGWGALVQGESGEAEVVRMSVAVDVRRQGVATAILERLCDEARKAGHYRVVLETNAEWANVVALYEKYGFQIRHYEDGDFGREAYFALDL